jgi:hypothetical protein
MPKKNNLASSGHSRRSYRSANLFSCRIYPIFLVGNFTFLMENYHFLRFLFISKHYTVTNVPKKAAVVYQLLF